MTTSELAAIRARLQKASTGPWKVSRMRNHWRSTTGDGITHPAIRTFRVPKRMYELAGQQVEADAEFMARARQDVPALLAEFDRLLDAVQRARLKINALHDATEEELHESLERLVTFLATVQSE